MSIAVEGSGAGAHALLPTIPNATVARGGLLDRLDADPAERFVLLAAPAGSGKTALLAAWAARLEVPLVWFGCQEIDGDRLVFWSRFEQALLAGLGPSGMVGAEVVGPDASAASPSAAADAIVAQLSPIAGPAVIVIDDLHLAGPTPAELVALIAGMAPSIRLVVSTRVDPPFSLARMRLHGTLLELRQEHLRFTAEETAEALRATGLDLGDDEVAQLHELTEGWPAGVHLVALALRDRSAERRAAALAHLADLAAHDRNLGAFLLAEVVDVLPPDLRSFVEVTALLEWFDPALHDEITGRTDGYALLEQVRARNLFLVELETDPPTFRYHHLVQEFLRARFALEDPEGVATIRRRAAEVHIERHDYGAALPHLLANGDLDLARNLLALEVLDAASLLQPDGATVARRWLAEHGEAQLASDPAGLLECTMALNAGGFHAEAEVWLRRWSEVEPQLDARQRALLHGAWSQHHLFTGAPERCGVEAAESRRLFEEAAADDVWGHSLAVLEAQAPMWAGDLDGVRATTAVALGRAAVPLPMALVRLPAFAAWADATAGALRAADATAAGALRMADELGLAPGNFSRGEPELVRALVAHGQARDADATAHLERALHVAEAGRPQVEVQCLLLAASLAARRGQPEGVADALARARSRFQAPSPLVLATIDEVEARLALQHGDRRGAAAALSRLPDGHVAELLRARVALAAGDRARAAEHVAAAGPPPAGLRATLDRGLVATLVRPAGERVDAVDDLTGLVALAADEHLVRPFLDEGPELWDLLAEAPVTGHVGAFRDEVLAAARQVVPVARVGDQSALIDPLSERELTVLRYLASRLDSSEIAAALYISVNTVRSHVKAIYRKLGVGSRPDAVARARELDLL